MKKFKSIIKKIWRFPYRLHNKLKLKNHSFSIISCNCIAGGYYHDAFQEFRTPTINLTVLNYLPFVENLQKYIDMEMENNGVDGRGFPLGKLDDVIIRGVHYKTFELMYNAWEKRKKRIYYNEIYIIATDEFVKTDEDLERFDKLPFPKVCFISQKSNLKYEWQVYLPGYEQLKQVGDSMVYCDIFGRRINEKYFDYIYWLNNKKIKHKR